MTEFDRTKIDAAFDRQVERARIDGSPSELLFMIDAPLREWAVAVDQMLAQGGKFSAIADASVTMICGMAMRLAAAIKADNKEEIVSFANMFMHEIAITMNDAVNYIDAEHEVEKLDPKRTEH